MIITPENNDPKHDRAEDAQFLEAFRRALRELGVGQRPGDAADEASRIATDGTDASSDDARHDEGSEKRGSQ